MRRLISLTTLAFTLFFASFSPLVLGGEGGEVSDGQGAAAPDAALLFAEGQSCFYNTDYDCALRKFGEYRKLEPNDPAVCWRTALCILLKAKREQNVKNAPKLDAKASETAKDFFESVSKGLETVKQKRNTDGDGDLFCVEANLYMDFAIAEFGQKKFWSYLDGKDYTKKALEAAGRSSLPCARFVEGLIEYKAAEHPYISALYGIPHNRERALERIVNSARNNSSIFLDDIWFALFDIATDAKNAELVAEVGINDDYRLRLFAYLFAKYQRNSKLIKYYEGHNRWH